MFSRAPLWLSTGLAAAADDNDALGRLQTSTDTARTDAALTFAREAPF